MTNPMTPAKEIKEIVRQVYIRACLDTLDKNNQGKGRELCEKLIPLVTAEIKQRIREKMPNELKTTLTKPIITRAIEEM